MSHPSFPDLETEKMYFKKIYNNNRMPLLIGVQIYKWKTYILLMKKVSYSK